MRERMDKPTSAEKRRDLSQSSKNGRSRGSRVEVYPMDPPSYSDGDRSLCPWLTVDSTFLESNWIEDPGFLGRLWRFHFNRYLRNHGSESVQLQPSSFYWQDYFHPDTFSRRPLETAADQSRGVIQQGLRYSSRLPLQFTFYIPLHARADADERTKKRYVTFLLKVGRILKSMALAQRRTLVASEEEEEKESTEESIEESIEEEKNSLKEKRFQKQKRQQLQQKRRKRQRFNERRKSLIVAVVESSSEHERESGVSEETGATEEEDLTSRTSTPSLDSLTSLPSHAIVQITGLPIGYHVYEQVHVTYPPPPPFFQSIRKPPLIQQTTDKDFDGSLLSTDSSKDSSLKDSFKDSSSSKEISAAHRPPSIQVCRQLTVFGAPGAGTEPLDVDAFARHLFYLYSVVDESVRRRKKLPMLQEDEGASPLHWKTSVSLCRPGDLVWVELDQLQVDREALCGFHAVDSSSSCERAMDADLLNWAHAHGIRYWAGHVRAVSRQEVYRIQLLTWPRIFRRRRPGLHSQWSTLQTAWDDTDFLVPARALLPYLSLCRSCHRLASFAQLRQVQSERVVHLALERLLVHSYLLMIFEAAKFALRSSVDPLDIDFGEESNNDESSEEEKLQQQPQQESVLLLAVRLGPERIAVGDVVRLKPEFQTVTAALADLGTETETETEILTETETLTETEPLITDENHNGPSKDEVHECWVMWVQNIEYHRDPITSLLLVGEILKLNYTQSSHSSSSSSSSSWTLLHMKSMCGRISVEASFAAGRVYAAWSPSHLRALPTPRVKGLEVLPQSLHLTPEEGDVQKLRRERVQFYRDRMQLELEAYEHQTLDRLPKLMLRRTEGELKVEDETVGLDRMAVDDSGFQQQQQQQQEEEEEEEEEKTPSPYLGPKDPVRMETKEKDVEHTIQPKPRRRKPRGSRWTRVKQHKPASSF